MTLRRRESNEAKPVDMTTPPRADQRGTKRKTLGPASDEGAEGLRVKVALGAAVGKSRESGPARCGGASDLHGPGRPESRGRIRSVPGRRIGAGTCARGRSSGSGPGRVQGSGIGVQKVKPVPPACCLRSDQPSRRLATVTGPHPVMSFTAARPRRVFTAFPSSPQSLRTAATGFAAARGRGNGNTGGEEMRALVDGCLLLVACRL
jgi:hypothetical protein